MRLWSLIRPLFSWGVYVSSSLLILFAPPVAFYIVPEINLLHLIFQIYFLTAFSYVYHLKSFLCIVLFCLEFCIWKKKRILYLSAFSPFSFLFSLIHFYALILLTYKAAFYRFENFLLFEIIFPPRLCWLFSRFPHPTPKYWFSIEFVSWFPNFVFWCLSSKWSDSVPSLYI